MQNATMKWIGSTQRLSFDGEIRTLTQKSKTQSTLIRQLRLYLDENGLIRSRGRINNALISENTKYPYLLPTKSRFTELLIMNTHNKLKHSGVLSIVTEIRQNYWIPKIRQEVKKTIRKCVTCRKISSKPYNERTGPAATA